MKYILFYVYKFTKINHYKFGITTSLGGQWWYSSILQKYRHGYSYYDKTSPVSPICPGFNSQPGVI